ncbi:helix-turn-helix domain-containing protein [Streptomyces sp. NPDC087659]|uniref:helix-turn-helix domain-containing protein n=1 Tax=Streptomyces sp. NPDC087659 TaxID=3365801 RepID=UPI003829F5CD
MPRRGVRERVRAEAAEVFGQGVGPSMEAKGLRVSRKSAYAWHVRWRQGGVEALRSKGPSGRPSRMRPAWREWLAEALEQGPAAHGWAEDQCWTLPGIAG